MVKQKFYAVKEGRKPGIYSTWAQTEEQVKGFSGALYKSFNTKEEALEYLTNSESDETKNKIDKISLINENIDDQIENLKDGEIIAFIDGSYSSDTQGKEKYSFGVILKTNDSEDYLYKAFVDNKYMKSKNIAGEIEGAKQAILWSIEANKHKIKIFYDYEGIEKWATKKWKSNTEVSKDFIKFIEEKSKLINIEFEHIKSHSGIIYNEKADKLARKALLSNGYKTYNDGSIYFIGFNKQSWFDIVDSINNELSKENIEEKIIVNESKPKDYLEKLQLIFNNQKVTINCYTGNKSYVQGKASILYERIISLAIEKLPSDNAVIEVLSTYHALPVTEQEVENEFSKLLPDFPITYPDVKLRNTLLSAVYNTLIIGYMPDYTCLVTPVFRIMEAYLHEILGNKLEKSTEKIVQIELSSGEIREKVNNNFAYFDFDNSLQKFVYNSSKKDLNEEQIDYLNELYTRYNRYRHPHSHWRKSSIDAVVITDIKTAHDLIKENLKFINKYYILF